MVFLFNLHTPTLNTQDEFSVGRGQGLCLWAEHTHTQPASFTLIECRCFGLNRVMVAVGSLKCLPTAVGGGTNTSVSHLFFKLWGWNCIPHSLPNISLPIHWESKDCKSRQRSIRVPLGGLRLALLHLLKSSVPETVREVGLHQCPLCKYTAQMLTNVHPYSTQSPTQALGAASVTAEKHVKTLLVCKSANITEGLKGIDNTLGN